MNKQLDMEALIELNNADDIDTERFIRFLRKRRSHRYFQDQAVPWETLNRLADTCRYAPTGSNAQPVDLNDHMIRHFYDHFRHRTWHGFNLLAVDGTTLRVPDQKRISDHFGVWNSTKGERP